MTGRVARARAAADARAQDAYRRYIDHLMACNTCDSPACEQGTDLRRQWRAERDAAAR